VITSNERSLACVLYDLARHPHGQLVRRWNWKSAVLSSLFRSSLFFVANLSAGPDAAQAAFLTELAYRGVTAGFYGALTQAFRDARPAWAGMVAAMILLPGVSHLLEFIVHWFRGTPNLTESVALSVAFTALSTSFNLFAMRRGALIVGGDSSSLLRDLRRMPALMCSFAGAMVRFGRAPRSASVEPRPADDQRAAGTFDALDQTAVRLAARRIHDESDSFARL
jgi:hypothetical protein